MKQYKVLIVAPFGKTRNRGLFFKAGFEKNGHKVVPFDTDNFKDPATEIMRTVKETGPDFILHTKSELPVEVFQDLRKYTKVVQWYPDLAIRKELPAYIEAADIFFTMAEGLVEEFRKFNPNVFWLTQAFEPSFFQIKSISPTDIKTFSTDVTFIGNLGSKSYYLKRRKYLNRVVKEGFGLKWWGPKMPKKMSTFPLIFGRLGRSYGGKYVRGEEYAKVAKLSKTFLAFDALPELRKSMSARMYTAVGCGGFYMCEYVDGIEDVLIPDKEIVTFRSEDEMIDLIKYYLKNDEARMKIAESGQKRVLKDHTYEVRIRQMLDIINKIL